MWSCNQRSAKDSKKSNGNVRNIDNRVYRSPLLVDLGLELYEKLTYGGGPPPPPPPPAKWQSKEDQIVNIESLSIFLVLHSIDLPPPPPARPA